MVTRVVLVHKLYNPIRNSLTKWSIKGAIFRTFGGLIQVTFVVCIVSLYSLYEQ